MPFTLPDPWIPDASVQRNFDALAQRLAVIEGLPARVTALPTTPSDGLEIYYAANATNGVYWHLKYNAASASAYKWEFVGGSPLSAEITTQETTTSTSYVALTTPGPAIALPLAGDYMVTLSVDEWNTTANNFVLMSYDIGGTGAVDPDCVQQWLTGGEPAAGTRHKTRLKTGLSAVTLTAKYRCGSGDGQWRNRFMSVLPVRVG